MTISASTSTEPGTVIPSTDISLVGLPGPDLRPNADLVIIDGNCQFCMKQAKRLNWFDHGERLAFISLHDERVAARYPNLTHDQLMQQMYVMTNTGEQHGGAAAVRYLTRKLPRLWWLMPLLHIPFSMPLWRWLYRQVAIRRYRWNQKQGNEPTCDQSCEIHLGEK